MIRLINDEAISDTGIHFSTGVLLDSFITNKLHLKYNNWFINIETVIRNFIDNMDGNTEHKIKFLKRKAFKRMVDEILSDIDIMYSQIPDDVNLVFYKLDYKQIERAVVNFKDVNLFNGLKYYVYTNQDKIIELLKEHLDIIFMKFNKLPKLRDTLVTTHIALDMLNYNNVKNVMLYESFTAELKGSDRLYSKYNSLKDKDMSILPFNEYLYMVFGDSWKIKSIAMKTRVKLYDMAIKYKWNHKTSKSSMLNNIKNSDIHIHQQFAMLPRFYT